MPRVIAIYGPPGVGKTTAAVPLANRLEAAYLSSGDIARKVDPVALAAGRMAERSRLREAFAAELRELGTKHKTIVVDGLPRDPTDVDLLPRNTVFILLTARPTIAIERQLKRGRPGDTGDIVLQRTREQYRLLGLDGSAGWARYLAGDNIVGTDYRNMSQVAAVVWSMAEAPGSRRG